VWHTDVRTYRRTDVTEPNTIAPPFGAGANKIKVFTKVENLSISSRARKPLHFLFVTLTLKWGSWKRYATLRLVMVHVCMKYRQIMLSGAKLMAQTSKKWPYVDLWPWPVTLTLKWGSWKRYATLRLVMVHVCMKYRQIMLNGSNVTARTSKKLTDRQTDVLTDRYLCGQSFVLYSHLKTF
jgi:hypothetical protein